MELQGQFFGSAFDEPGKLIGSFWLHIDPGLTKGHVLYRPDDRGYTHVAEVSISIGHGESFVLGIRSNVGLEGNYRIAEAQRLPVSFTASVTLDKLVADKVNEGSWTSGEARGKLKLARVQLGAETAAQQTFSDWDDFKSWADRSARAVGSAFRGQGHRHRLQSSFHRTGRVDMVRYVEKDLPTFADHLETALDKRFDLAVAKDFGAALGLAQHFGFPTPLLDWTHSPYVAAYFAFAEIIERKDPPSHVRLFRISPDFVSFGFDRKVVQLLDTDMTVLAYRPPSLGNGRLLNQQGLFTLSNVVDLEAQLRQMEKKASQNVGTLLEIVDVASDQARRALADLRNMGTTAATLFPGLDGVARQLKHVLFYAP